MQLYSRNSIVSSLYSQYTPITSPVYLQLFPRMSHPTPMLAVGIPGLYPHICYGHNLESCADIGSIYGDYIYIYPYLMVRSLSHYIKWYPHMISYFVYTVWIYIYIHKYIYIYIYTYGELYIFIMENYGITMAFYGGLNLVRAEVPGSPPSRPPGKRPVSNCRRCHGGKKVMERWEWWLMVVNSV